MEKLHARMSVTMYNDFQTHGTWSYVIRIMRISVTIVEWGLISSSAVLYRDAQFSVGNQDDWGLGKPHFGILHLFLRPNSVPIYPSYFMVWCGLMSHFTNLCMALQPFVGPWPLLSFLILYTVDRTPWTGNLPVARPLPTHRINAHRHPCFGWDSSPRHQYSSGRRQFMP
jgi:hypothetical protein